MPASSPQQERARHRMPVNELSPESSGSESAAASSRAPRWRRYVNALLAGEISTVTRYADELIQLSPRPEDQGILRELILAPRLRICRESEELEDTSASEDARPVVLLNGNFNHHLDIEQLLRQNAAKLGRGGRIVAVLYNPYLRFLYAVATRIGLRSGDEPSTFITRTDLQSLAALAGLEVVRARSVAFLPWHLFGLGTLLNRILPAIPFLRWLSLTYIVILRPRRRSTNPVTVSVVVPARNERGNIEGAVKRMPMLGGSRPEIIFVEGNSTDGTWEEIERVAAKYGATHDIRILKQPGKGKADAVRHGFTHARGELLVILDADLTMPPELLPRFVEAYRNGIADFINGSRLVYPMEGKAMRFLNRLGNIFFAKALSAILQVRIGDSLCGTKLLSRRDYERALRWRSDFGDFDPFGDFELLFPAAIFGLGITDVPVRYRDRVYGSTNILRFRHGWMLLKMCATGLLRVRLGCKPEYGKSS